MNKELADLRKKNLEKLDAELISARESQFGLRIKHRTGQLNETSELKKVRRKIAQIKTVIKEIKSEDEK
tara:strand:+ start:1628 stop:1834 length:207 start_codon:yes stop_codon:yes gene_type:complete